MTSLPGATASSAEAPTVLLVHGGLWEASMDANGFWGEPGIIDGLEHRGFEVLAPDRLTRGPSWEAEASHLAARTHRIPISRGT